MPVTSAVIISLIKKKKTKRIALTTSIIVGGYGAIKKCSL